MANIKLDNITKSYVEGSNVIENLSLNIADSSFVVLLGPIGSGKSAILRMIAGLDEITQGELYIDDVKSNQLLPKDRNIAMVFQNHQLLPHLSVYDNIAFGLKLRKITAEEINVKIKEISRILGIEMCLSRKPKSLTSLERQRVTFARALVREPNVCLFDDSLASLDAELTKNVRSELIKLQYRLKSTFVFATRDQIDAMTMASKIVVMNAGKIEQIGTPKEIYNKPKSVFVATYVGSPQINLSTAILTGDDEKVFVETLGAKVELPKEIVSSIPNIKDYLNTNKGITFAVRPENVKIDENGQKSATVESFENYGSYKTISIKFEQKTLNDWNILSSANAEIEIGKEVKLMLDPTKILMFDQETEVSIIE